MDASGFSFTSNAEDGFGIGKILGLDTLAKAAQGGQGTEQCGSRPTSGKAKIAAYNECLNHAIDAQVQIASINANANASNRSASASTIPKWLIYAGIAVGVLIAIKLLRR